MYTNVFAKVDNIIHSIYCFLTMPRIITQIITGAPTSGVTALMGIIVPSPGMAVTRLHDRATMPPMSMVEGMSAR